VFAITGSKNDRQSVLLTVIFGFSSLIKMTISTACCTKQMLKLNYIECPIEDIFRQDSARLRQASAHLCIKSAPSAIVSHSVAHASQKFQRQNR